MNGAPGVRQNRRERVPAESISHGNHGRYDGHMKYTNAIVGILFMLIMSGCCWSKKNTTSGGAWSVTQTADYERLKALSGEWYLVSGERLGVEVEAAPGEPFMSYSVSSGGHSVIEKLFVGKPNEMTSIYYLDSGMLYMDHYCSLGNQPRMKTRPTVGDDIDFKLLSVGNMTAKNDLHISSHSVEFDGPNELTVRWGATKDQKPMTGSFYTVERQASP